MQVGQTARLIWHTMAFTALAPGVLAGVLPATIVYLTNQDLGRFPFLPLGGAVIGLGGALYLTCAYEFIIRGRGTPAPYEAPQVLVLTGVYGRVRNPIYVAVFAVLIGESTVFASPLLFAFACVVMLAFHLRVVLYEEPTLARLFGPAWEQYRVSVPRWVPRLTVGLRK